MENISKRNPTSRESMARFETNLKEWTDTLHRLKSIKRPLYRLPTTKSLKLRLLDKSPRISIKQLKSVKEISRNHAVAEAKSSPNKIYSNDPYLKAKQLCQNTESFVKHPKLSRTKCLLAVSPYPQGCNAKINFIETIPFKNCDLKYQIGNTPHRIIARDSNNRIKIQEVLDNMIDENPMEKYQSIIVQRQISTPTKLQNLQTSKPLYIKLLNKCLNIKT